MSIVPKVRTPLRSFLERIRGFRLSKMFRIRPVSERAVFLFPGGGSERMGEC